MATPTPFPYQAVNAADAVHLFFTERVSVSDPNMGDRSTPELHGRICDLVASLVADRLCVFYQGEQYGAKEEIEFTFKKNGERSDSPCGLTSPVPMIKDLEYRFRGARIYLKGWTYDLASSSANTYALRVTPSLVVFGGMVVWMAQ